MKPAHAIALRAAVLVAATVACVVLGFVVGWKWLLPLLAAAPFYPMMVLRLRVGRRKEALALALLWAVTLGATSTTLCALYPERAGEVVWRGEGYWEEMAPWVATGEGKESRPSEFLPEHALHLLIFVGLSLATASLASIAMGAALMNYMSYYVGMLVARSGIPLLMALAAWHPWSVVRVLSYIVLGVVLAEPLLARLQRRGVEWRPLLPWAAVALCGLVADAVMKTLMAPHWPGLLRPLLEQPLV